MEKQRVIESLEGTISFIEQIIENTPELNMSNYSDEQVRALNNALIEINQIIQIGKYPIASELCKDDTPIQTAEDEIRQKLILRGFSEKTLLNNRGLVGAVMEEYASLHKPKEVSDIQHKMPSEEEIKRACPQELISRISCCIQGAKWVINYINNK